MIRWGAGGGEFQVRLYCGQGFGADAFDRIEILWGVKHGGWGIGVRF